MSIYCISDIHGCFIEFNKMLRLINFQESDELYILGDIFDRGPASAEMLWWATKQAPANVHFLLGNHEDMMLAADYNYYNRDRIELRLSDSWAQNYGFETITQIRNFDKYNEKWEQEILDWVDCLPLFYDVQVNGRRFILVHAGLQSEAGLSSYFTANSKKDYSINIEGCPCRQESQTLLWERNTWIADRYEWPFDIVCGHTPTCGIPFEVMREFGFEIEQAAEGKIAHIGARKHFIDCGVHKGYYLGCLRLDDMKEFYVKSLIDD